MSDRAAPPAGFTARPATLADATPVAAVIAADQSRHLGTAEITAAHVEADWGGADLEEHSVVVEDPSGRVVAAGDAVPSRAELLMAYGYVHPEFAGRGLGGFLIEFFEERARRLAVDARPVRVRHYLPEANTASRGLVEERGYRFARAILVMERRLDGPPPAPNWPAGVTVRSYRGEPDEPATYEAFELGSSGMWGRPGNDFDRWAPRAASYDPALFQLAEADGAIVGISISELPGAGKSGHVESLRVVPDWRRRGLGAALLAGAFVDLYARGARTVTLSVDADSPSGAPRLYLGAGMEVTQRYLAFEREIAP